MKFTRQHPEDPAKLNSSECESPGKDLRAHPQPVAAPAQLFPAAGVPLPAEDHLVFPAGLNREPARKAPAQMNRKVCW